MPETKNKTLSELVAKEPDLMYRMFLISFNMDALTDPEEAILTYDMPAGYYEQWAKKHYDSLIRRTAERTGIDPEILADKDRRTPEQHEEILKTSAQEQMQRLEIMFKSNYAAAIKHISSYCDGIAEETGEENIYKPLGETFQPEELQSGELVNAPIAAVLYFFATHETIDPVQKDSLTPEDRAAIIAIFQKLDEFYKEHRAELHTEQQLLRAYLDFLNPKSPAIARETLERIAAKRAETVPYPLDKINTGIWNLSERDTAGKLIEFRAEKSGSRKPINILYSIDFDELGEDVTITKRLESFDKRVYIAIAALYKAGNSIMTLTQIHYAMGCTSRPGSSDLERINAAISKMLGAKIYISNEQEAAAYKYEKFVYKGSLLPYEQVEIIANGQVTDAAIHLFREPPVITFARQRKQLTTIDVKLLQSPINKTNDNLRIDDYLIGRISRAKSGKQPHRILFQTLFKQAEITDKKQRQRAGNKIKRYLEHYKACGMITGYTMEADGITVYFSHKKDALPSPQSGAETQ